ncbi:energy transducer TonB [Aquitalea pelogenes]|uniref:energy transducer TonB n=1 Tax=Aquitalea pelogenes TaxID=1293573 RepID=UPI0007870D83|nr:energy transducer TonB [Aquitalea pelogenes]
MKLPFGLRWLPGSWHWSALGDADRLMLALSLSLLLHGPLLLRLLPDGSPQGKPQPLHVRLQGQPTPLARPAQPAPPSPPVLPLVKKPPVSPEIMTGHSQHHLPKQASAPQVLIAETPARQAPASAPQASQPAVAADQPLPVQTATAATTDTDADAQQWGVDVYYAARQVDVVALEQVPIVLLAPYGLGMDDVDVTLRVYINEQGTVDAVQLVSAQPAGVEQPLIEVFRQARFYPAVRDGRAVKSFKLVRIGPQGDSDASAAQ